MCVHLMFNLSLLYHVPCTHTHRIDVVQVCACCTCCTAIFVYTKSVASLPFNKTTIIIFSTFQFIIWEFQLNACEFTYSEQSSLACLCVQCTLCTQNHFCGDFQFSFSFQLRIMYIRCLHILHLPIHLRIRSGEKKEKYICKCQRLDTCTYINMFTRIIFIYILRYLQYVHTFATSFGAG